MLSHLERLTSFDKIVYLTLIQLLIPSASSESGWLKICNPEDSSVYRNYEVRAENCPSGVWLPEASSLGCICVNGLWVLTNDWCDENYQLVYGHGHCFNVENQVRKISYLGDSENAFESKDYIANSQAHVFHALNGSKQLIKNDIDFFEKGVTILRINPQTDLNIKWSSPQKYPADSVCLKALWKLEDTEVESKSLTIFTLETAASNIEMAGDCRDDTELSEYVSKNVVALKPGKLISVKNGKILDSSERCSSTCESLNSHERVKRSRSHKHKGLGRAAAAKKTRRPRILIDLPDSNSSFARVGPNGSRRKGNCSDTELAVKDAFLSEDEKMQLVNEETRRALKIETNLILNGGKGPKIENNTEAHRHWAILQQVKKVFLTVCPETQVPPFIINSVMRLFRYILIHTRDGNPYGMHFEDRSQDKRINDSLNNCAVEGTPFEFQYINVKYDKECRNESYNVTEEKDDASAPGGKKNVTTLKNVTLCRCDSELDVVNVTYLILLSNGSRPTPASVVSVNKTILSLPEKQKHLIIGKNYTAGQHDFITETIWKIINFAHFYCARHFEENPQDHSALFDKLESLFNKDIIYRWNNPGNKSAKIWKFFYAAYDIDKFLQSLDACVAGAKEISDYRHWLTRPTKQSRTKRELENPVLWDGNGYCMREQWEPLDKFALDVPQECKEGRTLLR